ncbi:DEAD/DEAH box helicase family protein [Streptomyces sp. ACA25]|uniref:DEAD/DEAH box helicase family protein n=1 Tax=Streptomyces sp. ACA25 TaxID=3022596 RepID=UPI0023070495|nr:DEAD/DEAH box helicase family protein [Streptomyces sp. ACA25]MDB1088546.1 DEAD/DEAH box helicase family protein [Streptomyces sp. ACA25]
MTGPSADTDTAQGMARLRPPVKLRAHQEAALAGLAEVQAHGHRRAWVVLPPGAGKTVTGLEAARRRGRKVVVFGPNTAIQGQWLREWAGFGPDPLPAGTGRSLRSPVTVLTYQALASFDPEAEVAEDGEPATGEGDGTRHLHRLRPRGRELVGALRKAGEVTLLLDECHHLLDTWGELLAELLRELPEATVIGLTATPPERLTSAQAELVGELFGPAVRGPSIPAAVREGYLAPYAELSWLTAPTTVESEWLASESVRFTELTTGLLDPGFASVPFLHWLDRRIVQRRGQHSDETPLPWSRFARERPGLATAGLRFHHAGLLELPEGARLQEEHRRPPDAADWVCLLDDYIRRCLRHSGDPRDVPALAGIRAALPSVGYQLTARGIRGGRSPVDRVLARSAAKTTAVREILAAEDSTLGDQLRAVVLCDHERASATLPARLTGVLGEQAGSARLVLEELAADPRTASLGPLLVTGRTVAAAPDTARRFVAFCTASAPDLLLDPVPPDPPPGPPGSGHTVEITGRWTSRRWVALATRFFESGGCRTLIGTRGMLGEGWDARTVNTLVDLTEATTATAVVQIRGRGLRTSPSWPGKVAHTWSVVCVAESHPRGNGDWDRFVRKHEGHLGITEAGEIMSGVAHVHPELSPYAPPPEADFDRFNALMLRRAADRDHVRALWRVGTPYEDRLVHTLRLTGPPTASRGDLRRPQGSARLPVAVPAARGYLPDGVPVGREPGIAAAGALLPGAALSPLELWPLPLLVAGAGGWAAYRWARTSAAARHLRTVAAEPVLPALAWAVADGLHSAGLVPRGAEAVSFEPDETGAYRAELDGVPVAASHCFATALDEVVSPLTDPRYLLPRYVLTDTTRRAARHPAPNPVVYHAVPTVLGENRRRVNSFVRAWNARVSTGRPVFTRSPEGVGLLAAQTGHSPLDLTTTLRTAWT